MKHWPYVVSLFTVTPAALVQPAVSASKCTDSTHGGFRCLFCSISHILQQKVYRHRILDWFDKPFVIHTCTATTQRVSQTIGAMNRAPALWKTTSLCCAPEYRDSTQGRYTVRCCKLLSSTGARITCVMCCTCARPEPMCTITLYTYYKCSAPLSKVYVHALSELTCELILYTVFEALKVQPWVQL